MAIADDISVAANGDIRYTGTTSAYTVLELHRFLQDLADNATSSGDDLLDITDNTPSERSTDNIVTLINNYNIDDALSQKLYDGSISQASGSTVYSGLRVLGSVNNSSTELQIIQDNSKLTAFWGDQSAGGLNGNASAGILMRCLIKSRENGVDIDGKRIRVQSRHWGDSYSFFDVALGLGENVAAISTTPDAQNDTSQVTVTAYTHVTNTEGLQTIDLINGNGAQEYYSKWTYGADTSGDQLKGMWEFTKDLTGTGTAKTIHGLNGELFLGITHNFAYDGEAGTGPADNDVLSWGTAIVYDNEASGPFTVGEAIHENTATPVWKGRILAIQDDGLTGTLIVDIESGTVTNNETFTGQTSAATADVNGTPTAVSSSGSCIVLAADDDGIIGNIYMQLIKGTAPANNTVLYEDGAVANMITVNGSVTSRTVSPHFLGSYTGTIIGAYGIGITPSDITASDSIEDLTGTAQIPPNNVTFTVSGLVSGEDRVLVTPESGGVIDQTILNADIGNTAGNGTLVVKETIPSDYPSAGTVRAFNGTNFDRIEYTSFTGSTFTLTGTLPATIADNSDVFISYLDKLATSTSEAFTVVYNLDAPLFVRIRDGGAASPIKTFESTATLGSAGGSITIIRTPDV